MLSLYKQGLRLVCPDELKVIVRPEAESSSRPLTPSPLLEGGGGVAKYNLITFGL